MLYASVCLSGGLSACVCLSVCVSVSVRRSVCVCLCACLTISLFACVCLSDGLSVCVCLPVCRCACVGLFFSLFARVRLLVCRPDCVCLSVRVCVRARARACMSDGQSASVCDGWRFTRYKDFVNVIIIIIIIPRASRLSACLPVILECELTLSLSTITHSLGQFPSKNSPEKRLS